MKSNFIQEFMIPALILLIMLAMGQRSIAQHSNPPSIDSQSSSDLDSTPTLLSKKNSFGQATISKSVSKSFSQHFSIATIPLWVRKGNEVFAYFSTNDYKQMACFSMNGTLLYSIKDFEKGTFPRKISRPLLSAFKDYSIYHMKEIKTNDFNFYEILLENSTNFLLLHSTEGEVIMVKNIIKTNPVLNATKK